jgi:hypothetical protein
MLTLARLRSPTDAEAARLDVAAVDLACAAGLPGSERLDAAACLAKIDEWAAWVRRYTEGASIASGSIPRSTTIRRASSG